jgi:lipoprotein-anchoring transpeptidase ErfK/SrfK
MRGRDYVSPGVPYAMCITANEAICMHAAPWQEDAGQAFGVPRSHGCVRMPTHQARWLFENTPKGTKVIIQA